MIILEKYGNFVKKFLEFVQFIHSVAKLGLGAHGLFAKVTAVSQTAVALLIHHARKSANSLQICIIPASCLLYNVRAGRHGSNHHVVSRHLVSREMLQKRARGRHIRKSVFRARVLKPDRHTFRTYLMESIQSYNLVIRRFTRHTKSNIATFKYS